MAKTTTTTNCKDPFVSTFDYVIVGAGPSAIGLVLGLIDHTMDPSRRKNQSTQRQQQPTQPEQRPTIAVIERGRRRPNDSKRTKDLSQWYSVSHSSSSSSTSKTKTDIRHPLVSSISGRITEVPIGEGLGGGSIINAGLVMPPPSTDFNTWPKPWSTTMSQAVEEIWQRLEETQFLQPLVLRGGDDSSSISSSSSGCYCSSPEEGSSSWKLNWEQRCATLEEQMVDGSKERRTYYEALWESRCSSTTTGTATNSQQTQNEDHEDNHDDDHDDPNVVWIVNTEVQRLIVNWNGKIVQGVECTTTMNDGEEGRRVVDKWKYYYAREAVILCAGAIESPALLLTSGLGPDTHSDYQGVGRHLRDQFLIPKVFFTPWRHPTSHNDNKEKEEDEKERKTMTLSSNGIAKIGQLVKDDDQIFQVAIVDSTSHQTIVPFAVAMILRRLLPSSSPFLQQILEWIYQILAYSLQFLIRWTPIGYLLRHYTRTILLFSMHPTSEGSIRIESATTTATKSNNNNNDNNMTEACLRRSNVTLKVDVGYGRDPRDYEILQEAWKCLQPQHPNGSDESSYYYNIIPNAGLGLLCHHASMPYFHYMGTCAMKKDDGHLDWVVDPLNLKFRDFEGLYICDASVFPHFVSVPPALTCVALGYAFSQILLTTTTTTTSSVSRSSQDQDKEIPPE